MNQPLTALALLLVAVSAFAKDTPMPADQAAMVEIERAFVRLAAEKGFRDSFYYYFAEEGIAFAPHPIHTRMSLERVPSDPGPMGAVWAPVYGDISQAGDLGWNTGPLLYEAQPAQNQPERHGMFFSIWEKQPDGSWRVVLDVGSDTPGRVVPIDTPYQTSWRKPAKKAAAVDVTAEAAALLAVERALISDMSHGVGPAYLKRLAEDARVHRPGAMPTVGRQALETWALAQPHALTGEALFARVARSGDLGYAYGSYEIGGESPTAGYYARVWKRDVAGDWRIVFDTNSPLPAGLKPLPRELLGAEDLYVAQNWAGAAAAFQSYATQHPDYAYAWARLGASQVKLRQLPEAIASLQKAVAVSGGSAIAFYNLARAHALSGDSDQALDYVEQAINAGLKNRQQYESDADLAALRDLPRFKELLQRL